MKESATLPLKLSRGISSPPVRISLRHFEQAQRGNITEAASIERRSEQSGICVFPAPSGFVIHALLLLSDEPMHSSFYTTCADSFRFSRGE